MVIEMKGFVVVALSDVGVRALDQCIQEEKVELSRQPLLDRLKFKRVWVQEIKRNPLTYSMLIHPDAERLLLESNPNLISDCVSEVKVAMFKNGASLHVDFTVEVSHD